MLHVSPSPPTLLKCPPPYFSLSLGPSLHRPPLPNGHTDQPQCPLPLPRARVPHPMGRDLHWVSFATHLSLCTPFPVLNETLRPQLTMSTVCPSSLASTCSKKRRLESECRSVVKVTGGGAGALVRVSVGGRDSKTTPPKQEAMPSTSGSQLWIQPTRHWSLLQL